MSAVLTRISIKPLHRATTFDKTQYRRKMHRTTVAGTAPESALASMPGANAA